MTDAERGQVTDSAAEVYEEFFVPALFGEWADRMVEEAGIGPGHRVLDVGCGTGVLARRAAERAGPRGTVTGVDPNRGMLAVARTKMPGAEWHEGRAEALSFDTGRFDVVVSQFALMFFEDQVAGLREMARVTRPGGRLAVAVWSRLDACPGYAAVVEILAELFGDEAAAALRAPFALGEPERLRSLVVDAGLPDPEIRARSGTARFPSIRAWMYTDVRGWTLADRIDDEQFEGLVRVADARLERFVDGAGRVAFEMPALIAVARVA